MRLGNSRSRCIRLISRLLTSQSGNIKPRVGVIWGEAAGAEHGAWSYRLFLRERRDRSVSYPNLFTFTLRSLGLPFLVIPALIVYLVG